MSLDQETKVCFVYFFGRSYSSTILFRDLLTFSSEKKPLAWHCLQVSLFASVQFVYLQVPYTIIQKGETCKFDAKCSQFLVAPFGEICLMMYPKFKYLHRIALFGSFKKTNT